MPSRNANPGDPSLGFGEIKREIPACANCGAELPPVGSKGGRPRKYCLACAPPGDAATINRTWRRMHPEAVEAQNYVRRVEYRRTHPNVRWPA